MFPPRALLWEFAWAGLWRDELVLGASPRKSAVWVRLLRSCRRSKRRETVGDLGVTRCRSSLSPAVLPARCAGMAPLFGMCAYWGPIVCDGCSAVGGFVFVFFGLEQSSSLAALQAREVRGCRPCGSSRASRGWTSDMMGGQKLNVPLTHNVGPQAMQRLSRVARLPAIWTWLL